MNERIEKRVRELWNMKNEEFFYERMTLLEEAYEFYKDEKPGRRYAHAFAYVLEHMEVFIREDELIAGSVREIVPNEQQEAVYQETIARKGNKNDMQWGFSFESLNLQKSEEWVDRYAPEWFASYGHHTVDHKMLLSKGLGGICDYMLDRLANDQLSESQREFYENGVIVCKGFGRFAERYAEKARALAGSEKNEKRKAELLTMAENFDQVPMGPAKSFYQALQSLWLLQLVLSNVCGARDYAFGRMDQYLYPYYAADLAQGRITREFALELVESFYVKINEIIGFCVYNWKPKRSLCNHSLQYIYTGGVDSQGKSAVNEVSYILLDASEDLKLQQPTVYVHYRKDMDRDFLKRAVEITKQGRGDPAYYNDAVIIEALVSTGVVSREDAENFTHYGCNNINLTAQEDEIREFFNIIPKFLELSINSGVDMLTGKKLLNVRKTTEEITSIDDIVSNMREGLDEAVENSKKITAGADAICRKNKEFSFESLLLPDCLKKGIDMTRWTKYKHCNVHAAGLATAGDSLYTIDRLVFKEKRLSLSQLCAILKSDWKGHEDLLEEVLTKFPKFGNDDDTADSYTTMLAEMFGDTVRRHSPIREDEGIERILIPTFYSLDYAIPMGRLCAASANGRRMGESISENQSPTYGVMRNGPTAALNSISKFPFSRYTATGGLNVKLQKSFVKGENGTQVLQGLLEGYFERGGMHMQVMVSDQEMLLAAREHPEQYRDLLVRITGYSAYFVTLSPDEQQEIINRSSFG